MSAVPQPGAATAPDILSVEGLTVSVRTETGDRPLVQDLSFTLRRGETLAIAAKADRASRSPRWRSWAFCRPLPCA